MTGVLNLVSVGPGFADLIIPRAENALRESSVIVAYELYLRWIGPWIVGKEIHTPPLTQERERALLAIEKARAGATVALISSGDIGIYAMAALAYDEIREDDTFTVNVIPGVTSANACASLLGSPLSHDFATLSLSDLLCPWDWIEQRARHIAQADLACVLYNVQSAGRQEGVYRILNLMLESKAPGTLCGVVKNAYRPGQEVAIYSLQDLLTLKFDMLTTIVIGNRFTQRKRDQIFTPRGYNEWRAPETETPTSADDAAPFPTAATWVFSGTSDGNALARSLATEGNPVVVSAATEYGGEVALQDCPGVTVWAGRQGVEARRQALVKSHARVLVDATHPYATIISEQLIALSQELGIPYIRYERPSGLASAHAGAENALLCTSMAEAAQRAMAIGKRIFLATGSKDLGSFLQAPGAVQTQAQMQTQWFARITPDAENLQRAFDLGLPRSHICAMQGPFSQDFNQALWRDWSIDCIVTKDSGDAGGFQAKVDAAAALGIPLLVVQRPPVAYPCVASTFASVLAQIQHWESACGSQ
ncbi:precorrin-3B C(17)-methyltransferase [Glaciimonas immobilis]|uniref:Precorrin-3B C17-methyltransferase n=1 Tax=Glaciimonas immobilis TaxID=728004 RepID=A0A840RTW3_9BURK|nr:precorrin-3B C(17)-methyltransferase [Glaciimonas immobilis]KAF3997057.1 precorrin-3B C(17)-methyltransferase [Glaciimonas immobilis]MBB5199909.1 precorrin-3B C17-methyltransferase [Glaciimonas immobilis]